MPGKAAKTLITERQQEILQTLSRSVTAPSHFRQRASIIVLVSMDPNPYAVTEPELLRSLRLS